MSNLNLSSPGSNLSDKEIRAKASGRASWHRKASKPVSIWMMVLFVTLFIHRWIPDAIWLMVHIVTLGLITNSIFVWGQHFTEALLKHRLPDETRKWQVLRIYLLNASIVVLMVGVLFNIYPVTVLGSLGVGLMAAWHGLFLLKQLRQALPARFDATVRFYITAAWLLPVGATFGAILANDSLTARWHARLLVGHEAVNMMGFVGITVVGTLLTLWPTMLRTKIHDSALKTSVYSLLGMCLGIAVTVAGALAGINALAGAGMVLYLLGLLSVGLLMVRTAAKKPPREYPTLSVAAGFCWLIIGVAVNAVMVFTTDFENLNLRATTPILVGGFLLQVLLGAMSYLLPVGMGGGPAAVRAANKEFNRFSFGRVAIINICLVFFALPASITGSWIRTTTSLLGAMTLAAFIPLMMRGVKKSIAARKEMIAARARGEKPPHRTPEQVAPEKPRARRELLIGGSAALAAVAVGFAADPAASRLFRLGSGAQTTGGTGQTTRVRVEANANMRFVPDTVEVPAGNLLILEVYNSDDTNVHDLALESGVETGRIDPGVTKELDAGVITGNLEGWCTIVGHRAMGMTFSVVASGAQDDAAAAATHDHGSSGAQDLLSSSEIDLAADPGQDFETRSAVLEPVPEGDLEEGRTVHRLTLDVSEITEEIAPGYSLKAWTFGGRYMGPVLHGNLGDIFEITLVNHAQMGHSIDFHAGMVSPDENMRTIAPGERLVYRFEARGSGVWLYHCSTAPMSTHIAAGMFGAVIIAPSSLNEVDREYVLVQNETYLQLSGDEAENGNKLVEVLPEAVDAGVPSLTMWNGHANQYVSAPLQARTGERVRLWVLAAGPSKGCSFHVVGSQFDTVYKEGGYLLRNGRDAFGTEGGHAQALDLASAQGGFVEMEFLEPGTYTFVNHSFAEMERGARGLIEVS